MPHHPDDPVATFPSALGSCGQAEIDNHRTSSRSSSSMGPDSSSDEGTTMPRSGSPGLRGRPRLGSRQTSATMVIPRESEQVEMHAEVYSEGDARSMSPRRTNEEIEKLSKDARLALVEQARALQSNLMAMVDRVEEVRAEQEKLEGGNRFLQSYIGELMQTSKITSTGAGNKGKGKARAGR